MTPTVERATRHEGDRPRGGRDKAGRRRGRHATGQVGDADSGGGGKATEGHMPRSSPTLESSRLRQATERRRRQDRQVTKRSGQGN